LPLLQARPTCCDLPYELGSATFTRMQRSLQDPVPHDGMRHVSRFRLFQNASVTSRLLSSRASAKPFECTFAASNVTTSTSWPSPIGPSCGGSPREDLLWNVKSQKR